MTKKHATLSPSSSERWTDCTASVHAQAGIPNQNSEASRLGTVCHQIGEECLLDAEKSPSDYLGRTMYFWVHPESESSGCDWDVQWEQMVETADGALCYTEASVIVTDDMVSAAETYVNFVRERHALIGGELLVEQYLPIGQFTGEEGAHGSGDALIVGDDFVEVIDAKFGRKRVNASKVVAPQRIDIITGQVQPEKRRANLQMACYALGAIHEHGLFRDIKTVTMTIVQPYLDHTDSHSCSVEELREVEAFLRVKAIETETDPKFSPSFDNCLFCRAKGRCNAQATKALEGVFDIDEYGAVPKALGVPSLGSQYALLPFVEQWVKDVYAEVERALAAGVPLVRDDGLSYKLVEGKNGPRKWVDENAAAALMLIDAPETTVYTRSVISPADAEKLAKVKKPKKGETAVQPVLKPETWEALQTQHIKQSKGAPQVALETDPRPAINRADGFEEVSDN